MCEWTCDDKKDKFNAFSCYCILIVEKESPLRALLGRTGLFVVLYLLTIKEDLKLVPRESDSQLVPLVIGQIDSQRLHSLH